MRPRIFLLLLVPLWLSACSFLGDKQRYGAYFEDDGPPVDTGPDPSSVPDAVPRKEPLSETGNAPYTVYGVRYVPMKNARGYQETGVASWYGRKFHGRRTSSGEIYDMYTMTAAHKTLPLPTYVQVTSLKTGAKVIVRVNDRGPFLGGRLIDLSYMAARKLGVTASGTRRVKVRTVTGRSASVPVGHFSVTRPTTGSVYIQAGSFRLRGNADALRQRLTSSGIRQVIVTRTQLDNTLYYRVRVGPLGPEFTLNETLDEIRRVTGVEPRIVEDD